MGRSYKITPSPCRHQPLDLDLLYFNSHSFTLFVFHSCPTDQTLNYKVSIDKEQRFSFEAFRFTFTKDSSEVYLHCEVVVCHKDNNASRCNQACSSADKPRYLTKRDLTTREAEEIIMYDNLTSLLNLTTKLYDVSLGPLKVYIDPIHKEPVIQGSCTPWCMHILLCTCACVLHLPQPSSLGFLPGCGSSCCNYSCLPTLPPNEIVEE
jgi:hypothetical protein